MHCVLQFWDTRSASPILTMQLPERVYCADVVCTLCLPRVIHQSSVVVCL